ncbi:MAG: DUF1922 domain-containing protein [Candidatus Thermoplasmatota archaeon]|nr:DUF1922 domain-containing protein [Candidatus Thermoplasmatota archaeon]MBS3790611.1 DUF1922 domain-containing protein [Candidatus Thermoplasmatota archaeon]
MKDEEGKYGVIVCSRCKTPKTALLINQTTKCHQCGKKLILKKMKIHYRTDSKEEASWAIGRMNAEMSGGELPEKEDNKKERDPHVKASQEAEIADNEKERLEIISRVLSEELGSFKVDDVKRVYKLLGKENIEDLEEKIKRLEEIYEPEEGVFRSV